MFRPEIICFDLNKTLIRENSWLELNLAMGVTQAEDDDLMARAAAGKLTDQEGQDELLAIYRQRGNISRHTIMDVITRYEYIDGARELIKSLGARGYRLALVSGAMDILVAHVAKELGISLWRASNIFVFDESNQLVGIKSPEKDAADKAVQFTDICLKKGVDPTQCAAIGDGANDKHLFELTGHGVTFTDSPIENSAWRVVSNLSEVGELFR